MATEKKQWVELSMEAMIRAADDSVLLKTLPDRVRRTLFTTATAAWAFFSAPHNETATIIMLHLQWLADQELKDHGIPNHDARLPYYNAVDDIVTRFTEAELKSRPVDKPAVAAGSFDMSKES